jgi:aldehyde dehydrogenase (NAD+)
VCRILPYPQILARYITLQISSTEETIAVVQAAGEEDVDIAVKAAHSALKHPSWKFLPSSDRGILLTKLADLIEENKELFATIDAWDNGMIL